MTAPSQTAPGRAALLGRGLAISAQVLAATLVGLAIAAIVAMRHGRPAAARCLARRATRLVARLGPTFVKAGQILGTRRDVLPAVLCDELSVLRDDVPPLTVARSQAAIVAAYGGALDRVFAEFDPVAIAGGSVACVYRARLRDGSLVAVKLRRPNLHAVISADLDLMRRGARIIARLPGFHGIPVGELVHNLAAAVAHQLDLAAEAESLRRLRINLGALARVWVPRVRPDESRSDCIVMEFIPDLDPRCADGRSIADRRAFAAATLRVVYQMLFIDGLVHCDLHPGNLYFLPTGHVVVLDAGFTRQLSERMRRLFAEFFLNMAIGRGRRCAEIVIDSSLGARPGADLDGFIAAMAGLVQRNHGRPAKEFSLIGFATEMFDLQRRFGVAAAPELVFPLLALLVVEGTVRDLDPEIDFQEAARPVLTKAIFGSMTT